MGRVISFFYIISQLQMTDLKNYIRHRNYLWSVCSMTGYQPENEDFYYKLTVENAKQQFEKEKQLYGEDKKKWLALYKYRTELEMFINWRWWEAWEYGDIEENEWFGKLWEEMHDWNCNKFKYDTEEWKFYFRTID